MRELQVGVDTETWEATAVGKRRAHCFMLRLAEVGDILAICEHAGLDDQPTGRVVYALIVHIETLGVVQVCSLDIKASSDRLPAWRGA